MPRSPAPLLLMLALLAGCDRQPEGLSRDRFVRVNVALRTLPDSAPDLAARRAAILKRERVTQAQLEGWVRRHADQPVLVEAWQEIAARVDSAKPATPPGPPVPQVPLQLPDPVPTDTARADTAVVPPRPPVVTEPPGRRPVFTRPPPPRGGAQDSIVKKPPRGE